MKTNKRTRIRNKNKKNTSSWINKKRREILERFSVGEVSVYDCNQVQRSELPVYVNNFISDMKMNRPIKVPVRKNCMTGSGKFLKCHQNVETLVRLYGGKRMVGYQMKKTGSGISVACDLIVHSVWITPEGNLVDVTKREDEIGEISFNNDFEDFQFFIPVTVKKDIYLSDIGFNKSYRKKFLKGNMIDREDMTWTKFNSQTVANMVSRSGLTYEKTSGSDWWRNTSFSIPSTANGKYLIRGEFKTLVA